MSKLVVSNGAFSSLLMSSVLNDRQDKNDDIYYLGYFKTLDKTKYSEILSFTSLLIPYKKNYHLINYTVMGNLDFTTIRDDLHEKNISEIYLPINSSTVKMYKALKKVFINANFVLYEEGLMSYVKPILSSSVRKLVKKYPSYYNFYTENMKSFMKKYCGNNLHAISRDKILENISIVNKNMILNLPEINPDNNYALVLPQYYHQNDPKKTTKLVAMYRKNIDLLICSGYKIIFKEHPKAQICYSDLLKEFFNPKDFIIFDSIGTLPVELVVSKLNIKILFSVYSTSLYTLPYLFSVKSRTSYMMLKERMDIFSIYPYLSAFITRKMIFDISDLASNNLFKRKNIILNSYLKMIKFVKDIF